MTLTNNPHPHTYTYWEKVDEEPTNKVMYYHVHEWDNEVMHDHPAHYAFERWFGTLPPGRIPTDGDLNWQIKPVAPKE